MTDQIPTKILAGRYQIIRILGEGGFGTTYLATDNLLPEHPLCVVKQLKALSPEILPKARELFDREARILQKLGTHPQIPRLYAFFEENQEFYLVQDYIEGLTLDQEIENRKVLSEIEVRLMLQDVLTILDFVHRENVIHRDIKPSNLIRRNQDKKFVLIDFGAVKQITNPELNPGEMIPKTVPITTKGYTPLEQMEGYPQPCSDLYALGVTAIQALTGVHPKRLSRSTFNNQLVWQSLTVVSKPFGKILDRMIAPNSCDRYQSAKEVIEDLAELVEVSQANTEITGYQSKNTDQEITQLIDPNSAISTMETRSVKSLLTAQKLPFKVNLKSILIGGIILGFLIGLIASINPIIRYNYYLRKGEKNIKEQNSEQALQDFDQALKLQENSSHAWKGQGDAFRQLGRYEAAISSYNKALYLNPRNADALIKLGLTLYIQGKPEAALLSYNKALEIDPNNGEAWGGKGLALIGLKRYQEALENFNQAQKFEPRNPKIWLNKALAFELLNNPQEARQVYQEALATYDDILADYPQDKLSWIDRGYVLGKLQQIPQAVESYDKAIKIDPNFQPAWIGKANMLALIQDNQKAFEAYQKAIQIKPQDYLTWNNFGSFMANWSELETGKAREEKLKEAIKSFEKTLKIKPDFYHAWRDRGLAFMNLNQYPEALRSFDQALNIEPKDDKSWIGKAITLTELNKYNQALFAYNQAIKINPKDPITFFNKGDLLEKMNQISQAIQSYQEAVNLDPTFEPAINALTRLKSQPNN